MAYMCVRSPGFGCDGCQECMEVIPDEIRKEIAADEAEQIIEEREYIEAHRSRFWEGD